MAWTQRNDSVPGYCYLIEAVGINGIIPGRLVRRCKIGLSKNPEMRLDALHSSQPPCDYVILKTIFVEDMASVEDLLHKDFKHCNIKLNKSREWFDLSPLDFWRVQMAFNRYGREYGLRKVKPVPVRAVVGGLVALLGIGILIGQVVRQEPQPQAEVESWK
ncbi:MAG: GIY-YIG nuclease family protein [Pelatocladus maniniholoensis HA4357-MV3]|jgi:hypothetical protein|uniref:GIY-YIG nuclease family protein n=1 Tax=Pelatocladus maniniholoensis HA4357-MV3 TaxID=1117104 RepID=A0A9E3LW07_9NOST|nr:GIY-YIG nuclease family protein [Pelatocladus maniniholoensis HA4357-MV3]